MKLVMKMDGEPTHEHLAMLFNYASAAELRSTLNVAGIPESDVWPVVESAVFSLAMMFDNGTFTVNGKTFALRLAFVDERGEVLPGAAEFDHLHEYAAVTEDELEPTAEFSIRV